MEASISGYLEGTDKLVSILAITNVALGNIIYSKSLGKGTVKEGRDLPFTEDTICAIASMSKLMTSVAVLQCVEDGTLDLDENIRPKVPEMGKYGILTGFDDEKGTATFVPDDTPITLRMLLSHTSGHEYEFMSAELGKWRASRNERPWQGATVEDKAAIPLSFKPGTSFAYGTGNDWAGKLVELATGMSLEDFMRTRIWTPLGIDQDISFWPKTKEGMRDRVADISTLDEEGKPPAIDSQFDFLAGTMDCTGGGGLFSSPKAYYTFLSAVHRRDLKLLTPSSYVELFRPQLDEKCEQAFNDYIALSPAHTQFLAFHIPPSVRKTWSFAGLIAKEGQEGRFREGSTFWAGTASTVWFIDSKAGICGTAFVQVLPPLSPAVVALHEQFQRGVFEVAKGR